jgi:hypothetical protein
MHGIYGVETVSYFEIRDPLARFRISASVKCPGGFASAQTKNSVIYEVNSELRGTFPFY